MVQSKVIPKQAYRRATWKNGLGHTDEIAIYPEGAELRRGNFLWRLSSARIEQASPFSPFPEHDRTLVVLNGAGVHLTHTFDEGGEEENVDVPLLSPYEFPGDVPSRCELISGPITDLSVFVRKAEVNSMTDVIDLEAGETYDWMPSGRWNFVFAAEGEFEVMSQAEGARHKLSTGDTLRLELDEPLSEEQPVRIRAGKAGKFVVVGLQA